MNAQNAKELLPLIQALADGKTIQEEAYGQWLDAECPTFYREVCNYRIKPEPRTFEIVRSKSCGSIYSGGDWDGSYPDNWELITVVEVIK